MNTRDKIILLACAVLGIALVWTIWLTSEDPSAPPQPDKAPIASAETAPTGAEPTPGEAPASTEIPASPQHANAETQPGILSPFEARPVRIPPHNQLPNAGLAPEPLANPAISAIEQMERRLQRSAAAGQHGEVDPVGVDVDRPITRPSKLEEEDDVRVGVVFTVGEDGVEAKGKGIKKLIDRVFDEDEEKDEAK